MAFRVQASISRWHFSGSEPHPSAHEIIFFPSSSPARQPADRTSPLSCSLHQSTNSFHSHPASIICLCIIPAETRPSILHLVTSVDLLLAGSAIPLPASSAPPNPSSHDHGHTEQTVGPCNPPDSRLQLRIWHPAGSRWQLCFGAQATVTTSTSYCTVSDTSLPTLGRSEPGHLPNNSLRCLPPFDQAHQSSGRREIFHARRRAQDQLRAPQLIPAPCPPNLKHPHCVRSVWAAFSSAFSWSCPPAPCIAATQSGCLKAAVHQSPPHRPSTRLSHFGRSPGSLSTLLSPSPQPESSFCHPNPQKKHSPALTRISPRLSLPLLYTVLPPLGRSATLSFLSFYNSSTTTVPFFLLPRHMRPPQYALQYSSEIPLLAVARHPSA